MISDKPIDKLFEKIQEGFEECSLHTVNNVYSYFEEEVDIKCQIRNIYRKISDRGTNFNNARVQYIHSLCELARISYELTKKVKELKKDNKFSVSRFIEKKDQETGRWRQNPNANEWNSLFAKGETIKAQVYKIIKEEALGIIKEEARIRDEMIAARRSFMLVVHLGWNVISKSKRIDPSRLKVMPKSKWEDLIKNIKEKYSVDIDYKLIEKSLKEVEDNF